MDSSWDGDRIVPGRIVGATAQPINEGEPSVLAYAPPPEPPPFFARRGVLIVALCFNLALVIALYGAMAFSGMRLRALVLFGILFLPFLAGNVIALRRVIGRGNN